jgi:transposase
MLGRKAFAPTLLDQFPLAARVPEDHLPRRVAAVVDFAFVRRLTARFSGHTGRPGLDPVVRFELSLLGYLYGITSERRLAEEVRLRLAYRWFLGYDLDEATPDHSVLSKARARFGVAVYQAFFTELVRQCEQAGHIRGDRLSADRTLTAANASLDSTGARALVAQLPGADEHLAAVWRDNPGEPEAETPPPAPPAAAVEGPATATGPRAPRPADPANASLGRWNERLVGRTDPDAAPVARDEVPAGLSSKVHVGVDGGTARVLTAVEATSGEVGDERLLARLIREHTGSAHLTTRRARRSLRRRGRWVEPVNAELQERQGLRRARCRGRAKVQMPADGAALASSVERLGAGMRPRPLRPAGALHSGRRHRIAAVDSTVRGHSHSARRRCGDRPRRDQ